MSESENNLEQRDDELNKQMAKHPAEESIETLVKDAHRAKRRFRILAISVILDIFLSLGLAYVTVRLAETTRLSQTNKAAVIANCETSNQSRKDNKALWDFAFTLTPTQPQTPEQIKNTALFKEFVGKTFAQRDCQAEINKQ